MLRWVRRYHAEILLRTCLARFIQKGSKPAWGQLDNMMKAFVNRNNKGFRDSRAVKWHLQSEPHVNLHATN